MDSKSCPEIDVNELVSLSQALIRYPNINPPAQDQAISHFLAGYLEDLGMEVSCEDLGQGRVNILAIWEGQTPGPVLLLNGHLDVVAPGQGWTVDPFAGVVKDGYLYGRGAVDMKSNIAALILAVKTLKNSRIPLKGSIALALVADEEVGQTGTRTLAQNGFKADFALVAEPTNLIPVTAHKGRRIYEVSALGKTSHAAMPEYGVNSIEHLLVFLDSLLTEIHCLKEAPHPLLDLPTCTLTTIRGGTAINSVPDHCRATIDYRYLPAQSPAQIDAEFQRIADLVKSRHGDARLDWKVLFDSPSLECSENMRLVQSLRKAIQILTGKDPGINGMKVSTDAGIFSRVMGIPTVVCGPGEPSQMHRVDERIEIAELLNGAKAFALMIQEVMQG
jgi:succinyl-diaminopimelate desuccinylase